MEGWGDEEECHRSAGYRELAATRVYYCRYNLNIIKSSTVSRFIFSPHPPYDLPSHSRYLLLLTIPWKYSPVPQASLRACHSEAVFWSLEPTVRDITVQGRSMPRTSCTVVSRAPVTQIVILSINSLQPSCSISICTAPSCPDCVLFACDKVIRWFLFERRS